ncbi:MAG: hypothetical protein QOE90_603 [Thermoplasmata archaeon]|nr:hypothetical protein [Thermoplasmata archaeon]
MILTILLWTVLFLIAFALRKPFSPLRAARAGIAGLVVGALLAFLNAYPGSLRSDLFLLALALILSGVRNIRGAHWTPAPPLVPRLPLAGIAIVVLLVLASIFPFTSWGASSVSERVYNDLNANQVKADAPALLPTASGDVRVVPWDLASALLPRGYGADASFLESTPELLQSNTFPDTVNHEFLWVNAPAPETAKWLFGGRLADKVLYVRNDANDLSTHEVNVTLNVHVDSIWWQHRVARYAENAGELRYALQDVVLQLDDSYHPYWIGYLAQIDLRGQPHLVKLLVVDAATGAEQDYAPQDAPAWIEQVYPESYVYQWAQYWGLHRQGFFYRWFNANRLVEPDDVTVRYIRLENQTYWLLPMRQLSSSQLGGYMLVNTRDGHATFYDRFDKSLVDYDTARAQLSAIMASGTATGGAGSINLRISEGYLYPLRMADGATRDAYVFPLLEGLKVSRFAVIDAQNYTTKRVFGTSIEDALRQFSEQVETPLTNVTVAAQALRLVDGTVNGATAIVDLNGTYYSVTQQGLAAGQRHEPEREYEELTLAIARANRGVDVELSVLVEGGQVVDVTYPDVHWG